MLSISNLKSVALSVGMAFALASVPAAAQQAQPSAQPVAPAGALELLTPENSMLLMIDHQPQMAFGVQSIQHQELLNNVTAITKAAKVFDIPTVFTTITPNTFSGAFLDEIQAVMPDLEPIERTSMNTWDNAEVRAAVEQTGRKKLIMAGLWTEVCLNFPVLSALAEGYDVYFIVDASGGSSELAHEMSVQRMIQAGAIPMTWQQVMLEWQRDWANQDSYEEVVSIIREHSGAYGIGIDYAKEFGIMGEGANKGL